MKHEKIRIYVGTYGKYNSGSIAGAWLTLNNFKNESEFWAACRALHKDERDPEFMFQDYELPDMLGGCITEYGADFATLFDYLNNPVEEEQPEDMADMSAAEIKSSKAELVELLRKNGVRESTVKYYESETLCAVRLTGGELIRIEKPRIKTDFCFGYGQNGVSTEEDYRDAESARQQSRTFDYFLAENLEGLKKDLKALEEGKLKVWEFGTEYTRSVIVRETYTPGLAETDWRPDYSEKRPTERNLTLADLRILARGKRAQIANLEKRCRAYWKRFGSSKLHTWTYLED